MTSQLTGEYLQLLKLCTFINFIYLYGLSLKDVGNYKRFRTFSQNFTYSGPQMAKIGPALHFPTVQNR